MELLAHIRQIDGKRTNQALKEHCGNTAVFGAEGLKNSGFYHTVRLACMIHDMGKAKAEFNEYMEKAFRGEDVKRGSVNHTFAGVIYLLEKYREKGKIEKLTAELALKRIRAKAWRYIRKTSVSLFG